VLGELLNNYSHNSEGCTERKSHLTYFDEYFTEIGTKTVLIEETYTDRDYLEDYAAYYARCHAHCSPRRRAPQINSWVQHGAAMQLWATIKTQLGIRLEKWRAEARHVRLRQNS
jgi:hypothetical protein